MKLSLVLLVIGAVAFLTASGISAIAHFVTRRAALSKGLGTLTLPGLLLAGLVYWLHTMEVDDAPPGAVIIGNLAAIAVIAPVALLASCLTVNFLARRASRKGS